MVNGDVLIRRLSRLKEQVDELRKTDDIGRGEYWNNNARK